jgi:hypothetical protein
MSRGDAPFRFVESQGVRVASRGQRRYFLHAGVAHARDVAATWTDGMQAWAEHPRSRASPAATYRRTRRGHRRPRPSNWSGPECRHSLPGGRRGGSRRCARRSWTPAVPYTRHYDAHPARGPRPILQSLRMGPCAEGQFSGDDPAVHGAEVGVGGVGAIVTWCSWPSSSVNPA